MRVGIGSKIFTESDIRDAICIFKNLRNDPKTINAYASSITGDVALVRTSSGSNCKMSPKTQQFAPRSISFN